MPACRKVPEDKGVTFPGGRQQDELAVMTLLHETFSAGHSPVEAQALQWHLLPQCA